MNSYINIEAIKAEYAPYNTMAAFQAGYQDYMDGTKPFDLDGVDGQAYDRGQEAAMKVNRAARWIEENVGAN